MARPREFDETTAVAAAAATFRRQGYAATSVEDLVSATGVHRASLYGTFGSKHGLFLRALDAARDEPTGADVVDLLLVALTELAGHDRQVGERVGSELTRRGLTAADLGARLLARAGLDTERTPTQPLRRKGRT